MNFNVLQSELFRLKFHSLSSKILKIPEFNLSINFRSFSLVSKTFLERLQNFSFKNFYFSFSLKFLCEQVKMFRIIALVFVIARSSAYAYEDDHHDEYSPWEFIFPDEVVT